MLNVNIYDSQGNRILSDSAHQSRLSVRSYDRGQVTHCTLEYLAAGMTEKEILAVLPDLEPEDIKACLAFAADREQKSVSHRYDERPSPWP